MEVVVHEAEAVDEDAHFFGQGSDDALLAKKPCADFVLAALQKGFLDENGVASPDQLGKFERGVYDGLSANSVEQALADATFNDAGQSRTDSAGGKNYTIIAHANYQFGGGSRIDFYDAFFALGDTGRYQTAIHEAMHLIWNIGDTNFAKAVGAYTPGMTGLAASEAWNAKLKENCK